MINIPKISKRLEAASSFAESNSVIADVGTDHAYLPIYLYALGRVRGGVVSDINPGPLDRAKANLRGYGCENVFDTVMTDGLSGIEKYGPDDIFILGMGGELIVKIIDEADWVKKRGIRLILQPMTHPEILREYLYSNGFAIIDELLVNEDKIYHVICAEYAESVKREGTDNFELLFGKKNLEKKTEELFLLLNRTRDIYSARLRGKAEAGADADYEKEIIENIDGFLEKEKRK